MSARAAALFVGAIGLYLLMQQQAQAATNAAAQPAPDPTAAGGATGWIDPLASLDLIGGSSSTSSSSTGSTLSNIFSGVTNMLEPRGIRNNNPGNIRLSSTSWQGEAPVQSDGTFVQFISPEYGIRAISKILDTYSISYGLNTVNDIISRWAPPSENNTQAYIQDVANYIGVDPNQPIDVQANKAGLVAAIIQHENGVQPYDIATLDTGVTMA
jgi:hypothetical protein